MAAQAAGVSEAIQGIASVAEDQSASTEQVSASASQMSEQVATMNAQAQELAITAAQLKAVKFRDTSERMMSLGDLCALVAGRVPLVIEVKSHFDGDRKLVARMAEVLASYRGPVVGMSFDPDQVLALRELMPELPRGIIAERSYEAADWPEASPAQRQGMLHLRHAFRTRPHFVAYWIDELPAPAPWIARHIFGLPLLTWTVRTPEQRERAARHADQMIFEGFRPGT
jgi:glycerophosphoryl diester phosphodiesterase